MKRKILLTLVFPGIIQISEGNLKLGILIVILNWFFFYTLWPILMPISLGLMFKSEGDRKKDIVKENWKQEVQTILVKPYLVE